MIEAFSTLRNKIVTFSLLALCGVLAVIAASLGVNDNLPGILFALLSATAFTLAFSHPWRAAKKFAFLLLASIIGFVLFVILNIILDSAAQNLATPGTIRKLIENPVADTLSVIFVMLCASAFIVGTIGSVALLVRHRRQ